MLKLGRGLEGLWKSSWGALLVVVVGRGRVRRIVVIHDCGSGRHLRSGGINRVVLWRVGEL